MRKKTLLFYIIAVLLFCYFNLSANNLMVENVTVVEADYANNTANIEFDISWENSWRGNAGGTDFATDNWDAAWVYAKYSVSGGAWEHCTLALSDHTAPAGSVIENPSASSDNRDKGVFIYRSSTGVGDNDWNDCKLKWEYGTDGVADDATVEIRVFGLEMCYVSEGSFYAGDDSSNNRLEGTDSDPVQITTSAVTVRSFYTNDSTGDATLQAGILVDGDAGIDSDGDVAVDNSDFPTGYNGFYCMKYEVTQGQFVDFMNTITETQKDNVWFSSSLFRHGTLSGVHAEYTISNPNRALNYLSATSAMAFTDWAGLRLLTELEYEKACRGSQDSSSSRYAWGSNSICPDASLTISGIENGTETISTVMSNASCLYGDNTFSGGDEGNGPLRVGIFAESNSTRTSSGASFYGIMELTGSLTERVVSIGSVKGRSYEGSHGNGTITSDGYANVADWPGYNTSKNDGADGFGLRGGDWALNSARASVSDRQFGINTNTGQFKNYGFRACRSK